MKTRVHFKRGAISHNTPDGKSLFGRGEFLTRKLNAGIITPIEMQELASIRAANRSKANYNTATPKLVAIHIWGKEHLVPYNEYQELYAPNGFTKVRDLY